jgi:exodeoxyribonuclease VII small subunit
MAKAIKKSDELSFEQGMDQLEEIVSQMESSELPLDQIIQRYEDGMKLIKFCGDKLNDAQKKVELIIQTKDGVKKGYLDEEALEKDPGASKQSKEDDDDSDVSLF